jgi:hypothetical protein
MFTEEETTLIESCWKFVDAMQRGDDGKLPKSEKYTPLEAFLVLGYAQSQAGIFRMSSFKYGDKGVKFIFPEKQKMSDVSHEEWYEFAERVSGLMSKITAST